MTGLGRSDREKQDAILSRQTAAETARDPGSAATLADVVDAIEALGTLLGGKLDDANEKLDLIVTNTTPP